MSAKRSAGWVERALTLVGMACLGWYGFVTVDAALYQREQAAAFERLREAQQSASADTVRDGGTPSETVIPSRPTFPLGPTGSAFAEASADRRSLGGGWLVPPTKGATPPNLLIPPSPPVRGNLIGMLDIPRLAVSTPVVVGDDDRTFRGAAGLLPDTRHPWELGNSAIAAHRDGLFRPLKNIRTGDEIVMRTTHGDLRYRVRATRIVMPDDLSVLEHTDTQTLTLITCYPFNYIGSAPKRFIVHADRITETSAAAPWLPAFRQEIARPSLVSATPAASKPKTSRVKARRSVAKVAVVEQKAPQVRDPVPEKKPNKLLRGLRAFGRAFKPQGTAAPSRDH